MAPRNRSKMAASRDARKIVVASAGLRGRAGFVTRRSGGGATRRRGIGRKQTVHARVASAGCDSCTIPGRCAPLVPRGVVVPPGTRVGLGPVPGDERAGGFRVALVRLAVLARGRGFEIPGQQIPCKLLIVQDRAVRVVFAEDGGDDGVVRGVDVDAKHASRNCSRVSASPERRRPPAACIPPRMRMAAARYPFAREAPSARLPPPSRRCRARASGPGRS